MCVVSCPLLPFPLSIYSAHITTMYISPFPPCSTLSLSMCIYSARIRIQSIHFHTSIIFIYKTEWNSKHKHSNIHGRIRHCEWYARHIRTRHNNNRMIHIPIYIAENVVACLRDTYHFTSLRLSMGLFIF